MRHLCDICDLFERFCCCGHAPTAHVCGKRIRIPAYLCTQTKAQSLKRQVQELDKQLTGKEETIKSMQDEMKKVKDKLQTQERKVRLPTLSPCFFHISHHLPLLLLPPCSLPSPPPLTKQAAFGRPHSMNSYLALHHSIA